MKITESFHELSIEELKRIENNQDSKLGDILNTKVIDLPENFRFSFNGKDWDKALKSNMTYLDFLKDLAERYPEFEVILSEKDNRIIGWMAYSILPNSVHSIKFGSLSFNLEDHKELLFDCIHQLEEFLKNYSTIYWFACEENEKIFNYYKKLIDKYRKKGYDAGLQNINSTQLFYISKLNRQFEKFLKI